MWGHRKHEDHRTLVQSNPKNAEEPGLAIAPLGAPSAPRESCPALRPVAAEETRGRALTEVASALSQAPERTLQVAPEPGICLAVPPVSLGALGSALPQAACVPGASLGSGLHRRARCVPAALLHVQFLIRFGQ